VCRAATNDAARAIAIELAQHAIDVHNFGELFCVPLHITRIVLTI
jgi:hypothetical protein